MHSAILILRDDVQSVAPIIYGRPDRAPGIADRTGGPRLGIQLRAVDRDGDSLHTVLRGGRARHFDVARAGEDGVVRGRENGGIHQGRRADGGREGLGGAIAVSVAGGHGGVGGVAVEGTGRAESVDLAAARRGLPHQHAEPERVEVTERVGFVRARAGDAGLVQIDVPDGVGVDRLPRETAPLLPRFERDARREGVERARPERRGIAGIGGGVACLRVEAIDALKLRDGVAPGGEIRASSVECGALPGFVGDFGDF